MNYITNILNYEYKKTNHRINMNRNRRRTSHRRSRGPPPPRIGDLIRLDSDKAPVEKFNTLVWKWNTNKQCYDYNGCNPSFPISNGLDNTMKTFFDSIQTVENYNHAKLKKHIEDSQGCWCCVFYIPFLIYAIIYTDCYWQEEFRKALERRRSAIITIVRQFESIHLRQISPTLKIEISANQGYITLTDPSIPDPKTQVLQPEQNTGIVMGNQLGLNMSPLPFYADPKSNNNAIPNYEGQLIPAFNQAMPQNFNQGNLEFQNMPQIQPPNREHAKPAGIKEYAKPVEINTSPFTPPPQNYNQIQGNNYGYAQPQQNYNPVQGYNQPTNMIVGQPYQPAPNQVYGLPMQAQNPDHYDYPSISQVNTNP